MDTVGDNMSEVSPTVVVCVPRFFEKMYVKIMDGLSVSSNSKQKLFNWALKIGKNYINLIQANQNPGIKLSYQYKIADRLNIRMPRVYLNIDEIDDNAKQEDHIEWDSLAYLSIISELEDQFNISISSK